MSFQSFSFLALLAAAAGVCLTARYRRSMAVWLLLGLCLWFYLGGSGPMALAGLAVLAAGGLATYLTCRAAMAGLEGPALRRRVLLTAAWHLTVLLVFQYAGFFTAGAWSLPFRPLGLSFFTFQQLWTLRQVWTGDFPGPEGVSGREFSLFCLFFPTVSSGPILKPQAFFPQLRESGFLHPTWMDVSAGLYAIILGTGKKVLLADSFGVVVNNGWTHLAELNAPAAWLVILGYTLQLYFDFSGYCDIATGAARLLGLRLPVNFNTPYRARSVGEFWKRWHITLTSFLRECLYFPLGGSRKGTARTYGNILLVFLVSGFWHGAGWTFLVWGALHGLAQVAERAWGPGRDRLPGWLRWGLTFLFVNLAWVFFRAPDLSGALALLRAAASGGLALPQSWLASGLFSMETEALQILFPALQRWMGVLCPGLLYGVGLLAALWPRNTVARMEDVPPTFWRGAALVLVLVWSILSFTGVTTFIYANF